ncbi:AmmeMemoRadiSam system radical SAM enzyme [bacterium]|nr:AmmeMemoRadiSam system radical SAM enzyme [candidate division CSSED10-310 bacterium]
MTEAMLFEKRENNAVQCNLCAHRCVIADGARGICRVRENAGGTLFTLVGKKTIARHVDPIEKKPLMHFLPGSRSYSIAAPGCNFQCGWCQNWEISQMPRDTGRIAGEDVEPETIVKDALRTGSSSIAYTYTEPTVFFEYALNTSRLAHAAGLKNVFITNGYMTAEALEMIAPYLDAANVDLKSFRDAVYRNYIGARLQPVLDTLKNMRKRDIWIEVTTLIVPGINDDPAELDDIARFIAGELEPGVPWHISRYFPNYRINDIPPTPEETIRKAGEIGKSAGLKYIYIGNMRSDSNTHCSQCGHLLIRRSGYGVLRNDVTRAGNCPECGLHVDGVEMSGTSGEES